MSMATFPRQPKVLSATACEQAGRWFVSLQVEEEVADLIKAAGPVIGLDLGIKALVKGNAGA